MLNHKVTNFKNFKVYLLFVIVFFTQTLCEGRLKIKTIDALDTPIPQIRYIIFEKMPRHDLYNSTFFSPNEWCLYFRFLYDHILRRKRYTYQNRKDQIELFITAQETQLQQGSLEFGVGLLKLFQDNSTNALIYEPNFQKLIYPFIQDEDEQKKLELMDALISMIEPKFNLSEFHDQAKENCRTDNGPCLDMLEMIHFIFLMGYSNIGLNYKVDDPKPLLNRTENTTRMIKTIIDKLTSNDLARNMFYTGIISLMNSLNEVFNNNVYNSYMNFNNFAGDTEDEKKNNQLTIMSNVLIYYAEMRETFFFLTGSHENPHLEQFFIKGGVMICTYGIKQYFLGDLNIQATGDDTLDAMITEVGKGAVGMSVSSMIDQVNIPQMVATSNQNITEASKSSITQNLVSGSSGELISPYYILIDNKLKEIISDDTNILSGSLTIRRII